MRVGKKRGIDEMLHTIFSVGEDVVHHDLDSIGSSDVTDVASYQDSANSRSVASTDHGSNNNSANNSANKMVQTAQSTSRRTTRKASLRQNASKSPIKSSNSLFE